jgi:hypothetical protein
MRFHELGEAKSRKPIKPLTPVKARARADRIEMAQQKVADITSDNAEKLRKARAKLIEI